MWETMSGIDIKNNICINNGLYGICTSGATGSGVVMDHNALYGNSGGNYSSFTYNGSTVSYTLGTTISSDPKLANETQSAFDAHLTSGSSAIGAGLNLSSTFTTDMTGATRPSSGAWDLGAYAYGSSSQQVTPPTVNMTAPGNSTTVSGSSVTVSANASSTNGIASVQFKLDGANLGSALTAAPYSRVWDSTTATNGSHTLTAVATDRSGNQTTATAMTVTVTNVPSVVSVVATTPNASRVGPANGVFTLTRTGSTSAALTVNYTLGGNAVNGSDYNSVGTSTTIPAGAASTTVTITPKSSTNFVGAATAALTLATNSAYTVSSTNSATVTIAGNSMPANINVASGNNLNLTWSSVAGKTYAVSYKNNLTDPVWTKLSGNITATGTTATYLDTTKGSQPSRFYIIYVTN
jgi:hypothetical protein